MSAQLNWTESIAKASQIERYLVMRSDNVLPSVANFLDTFDQVGSVAVERDAFGAITNSPYSLLDDTAEMGTNFFHFYVLAVPTQGPAARSNILPLAIAPTAVTLTANYLTGPPRFDGSWTASSSSSTSIASYQVQRSIDGGAYVTIQTTLGTDPRTFSDTPVDRSAHAYTYRVVAIDAIGVTSNSNEVVFPKIVTFLFVSASSGAGGSAQQIAYSMDGGDTWVAASTPAGQYFVGMAFSQTRQEAIALGATGTILRTTNGTTWSNLANNIGNGAWMNVIWVEALQLYIAVGQDAGLTTQRVATSPDGVTWTRQNTVVALLWQTISYNPVLGKLICVCSNNTTQSAITSPDGVTWTRVGVQGFSWSGYELANSPSGRQFVGDRGNNQVYYSDDLVTFFNNGVNAVADTSMAASTVVGGLVAISTPLDIRTSLMTGTPSWTIRNATLPYQNTEDMIYSPTFGKYIGIKSHAGSDFSNRIVSSSDGINWVNLIVDVPVLATSSWGRIIEAPLPH